MVITSRDDHLSTPLHKAHNTTALAPTAMPFPLPNQPPVGRCSATSRIPPPDHTIIPGAGQNVTTRPLLFDELELDNGLRALVVGVGIFDAAAHGEAVCGVEERDGAVDVARGHEGERCGGESKSLDVVGARLQAGEDLADLAGGGGLGAGLFRTACFRFGAGGFGGPLETR